MIARKSMYPLTNDSYINVYDTTAIILNKFKTKLFRIREVPLSLTLYLFFNYSLLLIAEKRNLTEMDFTYFYDINNQIAFEVLIFEILAQF